jgi:hypothetical protein
MYCKSKPIYKNLKMQNSKKEKNGGENIKRNVSCGQSILRQVVFLPKMYVKSFTKVQKIGIKKMQNPIYKYNWKGFCSRPLVEKFPCVEKIGESVRLTP